MVFVCGGEHLSATIWLWGLKDNLSPQDLSSGHEVCEQARSVAEQSVQTGFKVLIWNAYGFFFKNFHSGMTFSIPPLEGEIYILFNIDFC